ncbi:MAG: hypothetical protein IJ735_04255 [Clostridia bacterium]|nr:hypothetical protein [Clostridia bacterium]
MNKIGEEEYKIFEKSEKLGVVGTIDDQGDPHLSLLTTIMAKGESEMVIGQFTEGLSKRFMTVRPKCGFVIMGLDMNFWTGKMDWKDVKTEGEEFVKYNNMQMWRFNTYFGIGKVHYFDLAEISDRRKLDIPKIAVNEIRSILCKPFLKYKSKEKILRPYAVDLFNGLGNPKFLSYIDEAGYPVVVPCVQAQEVGTDTVVFTAAPYKQDFAGLKEGARVAIMAISLRMESVMINGTFSGFKGGVGRVKIDRVYNSIPPVSRYIYPFDDFTEPRV